MLNLATPTEKGWADRAIQHLPEILLDHAHCEKKAAATALGLIFRYPEAPELMVPLARLAREELAHFEEVLRHLNERGIEFRRLPPSPYAANLVAAIRTHEPARLLDTLLCCGLIEARSCERMKLLAAALRKYGDDRLASLYEGLLASEARHHQSYLEMADQISQGQDVRGRLRALAVHEADVLAQTPQEPLRIHGG